MIIKQKTQKGFTLIELLLVIAIIAILSTMILMMLDSGAERAAVNSYLSYGAQVHKMVADAVTAGKFDKGSLSSDVEDKTYCLGDYSEYGACDSSGSATLISKDSTDSSAKEIYKALTYLGEFPPLKDGQGISPYSDDTGVMLQVDRNNNKARVSMYIMDPSENSTYINKVCNSINWTADTNGYCYIDVPLHSRL
jgi:prepilin-type N-terminal cleavage/methylation domain-containing protein